MPDDQNPNIPATQGDLPAGPTLPALVGSTMSPTLQIMLDERLFDRTRLIAKYMAGAKGMVPPHLIDCQEACFAVITRAITWKLDPFAVAMSTYQTPGGKVGFEGRLCQAILENSGKLEGGVKFEHYGDWSNIQGKFKKERSSKGNDYLVPTWTDEDARKAACGVKVSAKIRGEDEPREFRFDLIQAQPRNSTLWATDPKTQICYTAVRRFASVVVPGVFMGVPFDRDEWDDAAERARDITPYAREDAPPAPKRSDFAGGPPADVDYAVVDENGEIVSTAPAAGFVRVLTNLVKERIAEQGDVAALWAANYETLDAVRAANPKVDTSDLMIAYNTWSAGQGGTEEGDGDAAGEDDKAEYDAGTAEAMGADESPAPAKDAAKEAAADKAKPAQADMLGGGKSDPNVSRRDILLKKIAAAGSIMAVDAVIRTNGKVLEMLKAEAEPFYDAVMAAAQDRRDVLR